MSSDLNQKYFEAKKEHGKNYRGNGYVVWGVLLIGGLILGTVRQLEKQREDKKEIAPRDSLQTLPTIQNRDEGIIEKASKEIK